MNNRAIAIVCGVMSMITGAVMPSWAVTSVWTNVAGGYWADESNWLDGVVPDAYSNVADFAALDSGTTVTITNNTLVGSLHFSGAAGDVWTLAGPNTVSFSMGVSPVDPVPAPAMVDVSGGTLTLAAPVGGGSSGLVKAGNGGLRLTATNILTGTTLLTGGTLFLSNEAMLAYSPLAFASPAAALVLESDAQIGGLETRCLPPPTIDLGGHTLMLGGAAGTQIFGGTFVNGVLVFGRGETQTFAGTQAVTTVRLEDGGLNLGTGVKIAGWWRFDDPAQVGKDSGPRTNDLVQTGSQAQWLTNDPERGSVLTLDGAGAYLAGPGGGNIVGIPVSNMSFTVAFWLKLAAGVDNTVGIYAWGSSDKNYSYNMIRLNTPASSKPLMHTNWGNNHEIAFAPGLMDGAWHHVAIVYHGLAYQYYIDGEPVGDYAQSTSLKVSAGNFVLGKGYSAVTFKGLLDDVFIAQGAMGHGQIAALRLAGQPPAEKAPENLLPENAQVEVAYNGKLRIAGDQTLAMLSGAGAVGGVELADGAVLKVGGSASSAASFAGSVTGEGRLVKRGAGNTLTLSGRIDATGSVEIAEGTLALANRLPPGLQAYYRFDDAANLGRDSSGHGYDLDAVNTPQYAPGVFGGAALFAAANQDHFVASVFPATVPTGNQSYTFCAWCNLQEGGNGKGLTVYWGRGSNADGCSALLRFDTASKIMTSNMGNNWTVDAVYNLASDTPDGGWHHITCTYDGATRERRVFFNGFQAASATNATALMIDGQMLWLGGAPYGTANYYDGRLDEVMIFDRALCAAEISEVMTGAFSAPWGSRLTEHVAARYSFEDAADLGKDSGPHGYHLSATGSVTFAEGKIGQALDLSVRSGGWLQQGYLNWTNNFFPEALPTGNAPVTITAWVNPVKGASREGSMAFWGTTVDNRKGCHLLRLADSGGGRLAFRLVDGVNYIGAENLGNFDLGDRDEGWHHIAAVVGSGGLRSFYVDGARITSNRVTGQTVDPGTFSIGYKPNAPTRWLQGLLDEVTVYDCALSQAEILETLRGRPDILSPVHAAHVAAGAVLDVGTAAQRVAGLAGAGEVRVGSGGVLTVAGGATCFDGSLTGAGMLDVRDNAVLAVTGNGTFAGALAVSNATLMVENASGSVTGGGCAVTIQAGGLIGGSGTLSGAVLFESGAGIAAGTGADALNVNGTVTLGSAGSVALAQPEGFSGGRFTLISATTTSAPSGLSGWTVTPAPEHYQTRLLVADGQLTLSIFRGGTLFSLQ